MEILIPEYKIERRVRALAHKITEDHRNSGNSLPPVLVCVLNGAFMFFSDLVKDMGIDCEIDFIRPKSYHGQDNSGGVKFYKELELDLKGKRVYIIEDIVDTGSTMLEILQKVDDRRPAEIRVVTLVHRKGSKHHVDFNAFEIGNEFIFGYGLDDNGLKRNYRNIYDINKK